MRARRPLVIAVILAALAAVLVLVTRDDEEPAKHEPAGAVAAERARTPAAPPTMKTTGEAAPVAAPVPPPAPPSEPVKTERPVPKVMAQDDFIKRRESGLELLDDTIARVERERDEAKQAGDAERVSQAKVRLERLATVRKQRADELEQARRGELQPNPDDLPAGPRP